MTAGWCGVVAPLTNIYALLSNLGQNSAVKTWPMPESRDPNVMTPLPGPPPFARPVSSRPGPWFGTIAALAVALFVIGGIASNAESTGSTGSTGSTSSDTAIVTCLEFDGTTVRCSDPDAYWSWSAAARTAAPPQRRSPTPPPIAPIAPSATDGEPARPGLADPPTMQGGTHGGAHQQA